MGNGGTASWYSIKKAPKRALIGTWIKLLFHLKSDFYVHTEVSDFTIVNAGALLIDVYGTNIFHGF